ncbi:MAG: PEP-CTERM sorting domain-containing protein [Acidobacteriota bacterium]
MKKVTLSLAFLIAISCFVCGAANAAVIYNSMPDPYPHNVPSLGYQATSTQEFGDAIRFAGTERNLTSVTVALSDWAKFEDWGALYPAGYSHDFTLNLYNINTTPGSVTPGSLIASLTTNATVPLRPVGWDMNGILFNITFDASSLSVVLPDQIVYGLAYNTQNRGYDPIGVSGPYNSLNFGLNTSSPTVGTDLNTNSIYWNTSHAPFYSDGGVAGVSLFREDSEWAPYTPAIMFNADAPPAATPEPGTMILMGVGALGVAFMRRRSQKKS